MNSNRISVLFVLLTLLCGCSQTERSDDLRFEGAGLMIVSIDTLRADRLGCYGNERGLTPVLDALASEGILFEEAYSTSPKTATSHMSLFTSLLPTVHGVRNYAPSTPTPIIPLPGEQTTLAEVLEREGYWNATIASGGNIQGVMGFQRGFGRRFSSQLRPVNAIVMDTLGAAESARRRPTKPPFLFVHTYQVHAPYIPPAKFRARFAPKPRGIIAERVKALFDLSFKDQWKAQHEGFWDGQEQFGPEETAYLSDLYDGEIAYTDEVLGRLFKGLKKKGMYDEMVIVVLSDHGEEFREHGEYQHNDLYREDLHVPLIIRLPGGALGGTRVKNIASLIDVMPTLLDLLGIEGPKKQMMGNSLVNAMRSGRTTNKFILAERIRYMEDYLASIRTSEASLIFHAKDSAFEAFDLETDTKEQQDVAWKAPFQETLSRTLKAGLTHAFSERQRWIDDAREPVKTEELSKEAIEELRQLGYLQGNAEEVVIPLKTPLEQWPEKKPKLKNRLN